MTNHELPILLVEDDENDVFFLQRALKEERITNPVRVAEDGQEAVDYLSGVGRFADRAKFPVPCLIILDLKMPRRTGLEVLEWIRAHHAFLTIPVIVFTSSAQPEDIDRAYRLGANAFVVKPPSVEERLEFARLLKGFWLGLNRPPGVCQTEARAGLWIREVINPEAKVLTACVS
jgi:CheY-like chemotaxis protein